MSRIAGVGQVGMNMRREDGIAMIVALMAMLLMSALGAALVMTTTSETIIAGNFSRGQEGLYAADAVLERAMDDLLTVPDWNKLLDGTTQSAFIDSPTCSVAQTNCPRLMPDGSTVDLAQVVNMANCGKVTSCSPSDLIANLTGDRPFGANNPVWRLYAYGK